MSEIMPKDLLEHLEKGDRTDKFLMHKPQEGSRVGQALDEDIQRVGQLADDFARRTLETQQRRMWEQVQGIQSTMLGQAFNQMSGSLANQMAQGTQNSLGGLIGQQTAGAFFKKD